METALQVTRSGSTVLKEFVTLFLLSVGMQLYGNHQLTVKLLVTLLAPSKVTPLSNKLAPKQNHPFNFKSPPRFFKVTQSSQILNCIQGFIQKW